MKRGALTAFLLLLFPVSQAPGGTFSNSDTTLFEPFIVAHPPGYEGAGGVVQVDICISSGSAMVSGAVDQAIQTWNDLSATTSNCDGCRLWEEGVGDGDFLYLNTVLVHELGHCAMGLGHINWNDPSAGNTSFTNSKEADAIDDGPDGVRGTADDFPSPLPGTRLLHWFRISDNDPFVIDETTIDINTYSRRIVDLPPGSSWPASGNREVGEFLGLESTQSVMYSRGVSGQRFTGLTADDVNTVQFGMSGVDELAGTADDYTISLVRVDDCASADIEIRFESLEDELGFCLADLAPIPTMGTQIHYMAVPFPGDERIVVAINSIFRWDVIFADGFESGDLAAWTASE